MKKSFIIFACLFVLGAGFRAADLRHPIDRPSWREADDAGIARNFYREGMNPFYPRVDWRGTTPGYAEMELPVYPWSIAVLYKLFGYHEDFPRLLSYLISLAAMLVFFKLARYLLPPTGAFAASLFFVLNPVAINLATWIQPDGLMFLCYTLAVYAFLRWLDSDSWKYYALAIAATAFAILAKATAGHIGLLFTVLLLNRKGWKAVRQPRVLLFALLALLPAALWYQHARSFWKIYGNSLGVSNEYHWAGWDLFTDPSFVTGIWRQEILHIWMPTGLVLAAVGVLLGKSERAVKVSLAWLFSIFVYYLIVARTSADDWAFYYHIVSLPPVALLVGMGVCAIRRFRLSPRMVFQFTVGSLLLTIILGVLGAPDLLQLHSDIYVLTAVEVGLATLLLLVFYMTRVREPEATAPLQNSPLFSTVLVYLLLLCVASTLFFELRGIVQSYRERKDGQVLYECAQRFAPLVEPGVSIVASGGACLDSKGYPVAYNASYMFYWLDRKGFNICEEEQSIEALKGFAARGARYFVAEKNALKKRAGFEEQVRQAYTLRGECEAALLFELKPEPEKGATERVSQR